MKKTNDHAEPTTRLCGFTVNGNYCKLKHAAGTVAIAEYCMSCLGMHCMCWYVNTWTLYCSDIKELEDFCQLVSDCCHGTSETERLSAVKALQIAGDKILNTGHGELCVRCVFSLLQVTVTKIFSYKRKIQFFM